MCLVFQPLTLKSIGRTPDPVSAAPACCDVASAGGRLFDDGAIALDSAKVAWGMPILCADVMRAVGAVMVSAIVQDIVFLFGMTGTFLSLLSRLDPDWPLWLAGLVGAYNSFVHLLIPTGSKTGMLPIHPAWVQLMNFWIFVLLMAIGPRIVSFVFRDDSHDDEDALFATAKYLRKRDSGCGVAERWIAEKSVIFLVAIPGTITLVAAFFRGRPHELTSDFNSPPEFVGWALVAAPLAIGTIIGRAAFLRRITTILLLCALMFWGSLLRATVLRDW